MSTPKERDFSEKKTNYSHRNLNYLQQVNETIENNNIDLRSNTSKPTDSGFNDFSMDKMHDINENLKGELAQVVT